MERKEIFILIAVCLAVIILAAVAKTLRGHIAEDSEDSPAVTDEQPNAPAVTTNYWDYLRAQTETTAVQTDENGDPIEEGTDLTDATGIAGTDTTGEADGDDQPAATESTSVATETTTATTASTTVSTTPLVIHVTVN